MRFKRVALIVSALACVLSVAFYLGKGLNFGIDFRGGILLEIRTEGPADIGQLRARLNGLGLGEIQLQEFGQVSDVLIRIERQEGDTKDQLKAVEIVKGSLGGTVEFRRVEFVGPKVSGELITAGVTAVLLALLAMMVYIWFRFEWLNDTVVVYDRVRENLRKYKTMPLSDLLDRSLNDTLSRTLLTSITTLLALVTLFFLGGQVIKGFSFAMIWGVIVGTYSSIWVAAPLLVHMKLRRGTFLEKDEGEGKPAAERS